MSETRKSIRDLQDMENKEEQFEIACQIKERDLTKKEWEIICEIGDFSEFIEILFPE